VSHTRRTAKKLRGNTELTGRAPRFHIATATARSRYLQEEGSHEAHGPCHRRVALCGIVIGAHGWGAFGRIWHGSVSMAVTHEAHCPVLVVRGGPEPLLDQAAAQSEVAVK